MCGLHASPIAEIQGKIEKLLKKNEKSFGNSKISSNFAAVFQQVVNLKRERLLRKASLAQLARARDL